MRLPLRVLLAAWLLLSPSLLIGCTPAVTRIPQPPGAVPTAEDLAAAQRLRLQAIPSLALRGHAEFNWTDRSGRHFDDGDFDLIMRPPGEVSLRAGKLGEKFLWIGSGGGLEWIVLPRETPSRAIVRSTASAEKRSLLGGGSFDRIGSILEPKRLLEAFGLEQVAAVNVSAIGWDELRGAWGFTLPGHRLYARGESLLPVGCDWLDDRAQVIATCTLDGFDWIHGEKPAGSLLTTNQPRVSTRVRFCVWSGESNTPRDVPEAEVSLAAQEPTYGAEQIRPQLFVWEAIRSALRPQVVEGPQP